MSNPRNDCDFCRLDANADQRVILRNDTVLFLQNEKAQGALLGSGVIIPERHAETVFDLTPEEVDATFVLLKHVKSWMDEHYHPDGYNVGWNCWTVGGQITMHAHMHVMPRYDGVALLPPASRKEDVKVLEDNATKLAAALG